MKARTLLLLCFAAAIAAWTAPTDTPEEAALKIETKLHSIKSLQSDYEHLYYSMTASEPLSEKGKLYFQRPDRMRWDSREPEEQTFLSKDGTYLFYIPEEKQLIRSRGSKDRFESEILALFSGSMVFLDSYLIEAGSFPTDNVGSVQLKLTPKKEGEFTYILLETDLKSRLIQKAIFFDWAGNKQEFRFSRIKVDPRFPPDLFDLRVPPDTEIIEDEDALRK
jgi:outer membrane lipoprotein carrier protein